MKVKSSIKKVGAVAGSALMVGLTMGSAATLGDYPQPFVDDDGEVASQIVVGSNGKVADVVGAVNIAAGLGQAAVQTETRETPGGTSAEVDGEEYENDIRVTADNDWIDKSSYSQLARETVEDQDENDVRVLEQVQADLDVTEINNKSEVLTNVDASAVQYQVSYTPGFTVGDSVPVLGENYEVTAITQDSDGNAQLELGSKMVEEGLELDASYEHGPYTITVIDKDESGDGQIYLQVDKNGESLTSFGLSTGETREVDNGALEITADEVFFGSRSDYIDVTSVYTNTEVTVDEDSPFDGDYTVSSLSGSGYNATAHVGTVTGLTLQNNLHTVSDPADDDDEDSINFLAAGDEFEGPEGYFSLTYLGLTSEETEELSVSNGPEVSFEDVDGFSHTLNLGDNSVMDFDGDADANADDTPSDGTYYTDVQGHPVTVEVSDPDGDGTLDDAEVTVSYQTFEESATVDLDAAGSGTPISQVSTGYGFDIQVDRVADEADGDGVADDGSALSITDGTSDNTDNEFHTTLGHEWTWDSGNNEVQVSEGGDANGAETTESFSSANGGTAMDGGGEYSVVVEFGIASGNGGDDDPETIDQVSYETDDDAVFDGGAGNYEADVTSEDDEGRTTFGSVVEAGSDFESVSLTVPEAPLQAQHALGSTETTETSGDTYEAYTGERALPDMAQLDSEVTESVRSNNHLILVGGPAVNTLVETLHDEGEVDLSDVEDDQSGAVLQVVNDAFTDGQHALVVAGYEAADTRSASRYLSNHVDHEDALADAGERMVLTEADYPSEQ